jgi:hypothetical protein
LASPLQNSTFNSFTIKNSTPTFVARMAQTLRLCYRVSRLRPRRIMSCMIQPAQLCHLRHSLSTARSSWVQHANCPSRSVFRCNKVIWNHRTPRATPFPSSWHTTRNLLTHCACAVSRQTAMEHSLPPLPGQTAMEHTLLPLPASPIEWQRDPA